MTNFIDKREEEFDEAMAGLHLPTCQGLNDPDCWKKWREVKAFHRASLLKLLEEIEGWARQKTEDDGAVSTKGNALDILNRTFEKTGYLRLAVDLLTHLQEIKENLKGRNNKNT